MAILNIYQTRIIILILILFSLNSCKKNKNDDDNLPEYYITFNDGQINKTFQSESSVTEGNYLIKNNTDIKFYSEISCYPMPSLETGILSDFDFKIILFGPMPIDKLESELKTGQFLVKPFYGSTLMDGQFKDIAKVYGTLTGGVKYSNDSPIYICDESNNSSNSYNKIINVKYLDKKYNSLLGYYSDRYIVEGEYKMICSRSNSDKKTITGKYRFICEN